LAVKLYRQLNRINNRLYGLIVDQW